MLCLLVPAVGDDQIFVYLSPCLCDSKELKSQKRTKWYGFKFLLYGRAMLYLVCVQSVNIHFLHLELIPCIEQQAGVLQTEARAK